MAAQASVASPALQPRPLWLAAVLCKALRDRFA